MEGQEGRAKRRAGDSSAERRYKMPCSILLHQDEYKSTQVWSLWLWLCYMLDSKNGHYYNYDYNTHITSYSTPYITFRTTNHHMPPLCPNLPQRFNTPFHLLPRRLRLRLTDVPLARQIAAAQLPLRIRIVRCRPRSDRAACRRTRCGSAGPSRRAGSQRASRRGGSVFLRRGGVGAPSALLGQEGGGEALRDEGAVVAGEGGPVDG